MRLFLRKPHRAQHVSIKQSLKSMYFIIHPSNELSMHCFADNLSCIVVLPFCLATSLGLFINAGSICLLLVSGDV